MHNGLNYKTHGDIRCFDDSKSVNVDYRNHCWGRTTCSRFFLIVCKGNGTAAHKRLDCQPNYKLPSQNKLLPANTETFRNLRWNRFLVKTQHVFYFWKLNFINSGSETTSIINNDMWLLTKSLKWIHIKVEKLSTNYNSLLVMLNCMSIREARLIVVF